MLWGVISIIRVCSCYVPLKNLIICEYAVFLCVLEMYRSYIILELQWVELSCNCWLTNSILFTVGRHIHDLPTYQNTYSRMQSINIKYYEGTFLFSLIVYHVNRVKKTTNNWLSKNTNKMQLVIECIIPKFIEGSTCFERHTAHHQEL
jgi:hypothetical protein